MKRILSYNKITLMFLLPLSCLISAQNSQTICVHRGVDQYCYTCISDSFGMPEYYYRQFYLTGKGKSLEYRIYWDFLGNFLYYTLDSTTTLTKVDHKPFTLSDYHILHKLLLNPKSESDYCEYEKMTDTAVEKRHYEVDAVSGATKPTRKLEFVPQAIKLSYLFWADTYGSTQKEIIQYTHNWFCTHFPDFINNKQSFADQYKSIIENGSVQNRVAFLYYFYLLDITDNSICLNLVNQLNSLSGDNYVIGLWILNDSEYQLAADAISSKMNKTDSLLYYSTYNYFLRHEQ